MNVRVTNQSQTASAIGYMQRQTAALAKYQDQVSSGLKVKAASDNPAGFPTLLAAKADGLRLDAYTQTMADVTADLDSAVSALGDANNALVRAKQIAQEGINGTTNAADFGTLAAEVDGLIDRMMAAGNFQKDGRYLFGGTAADQPPFTLSGSTVTYSGSADRARVLVGPGQTVDNRYAGSAVFQQAGGDAFGALIGLRDALRDTTLTGAAKTAALTASLGAVDSARDAIAETTAEQGESLVTLEALKNRAADVKLTVAERVGELESTDYAEAVVRLKEQETALQATMAVTARLLSPSLLDFIR